MVERVTAWRVVAHPASIDELGGLVLRLAPDDALVLSGTELVVGDPDAIVELDTGWVSLGMAEERVLELVAVSASWQAPNERPAFAQGMLAGLPAKVYLDGSDSLIMVPAPFGHELEERLGL
ncbi:MAG: hypothetical protein ACRDVK_07105 [Acidimicrobiia bacterium]